MKRKLFCPKTLVFVVVMNFCFNFVTSQSLPFNCDFNAYLFQYNDVYAIDLASGTSVLLKENVTPGSINAVGYNPTDGYIWGYLSSPSKSIVRVGKDFTATIFNIEQLPSSGSYVGDISPEGIYYCKGNGSSYSKIDLNPLSPSYLQYLGLNTLAYDIVIHDWAFNSVDGKLYAVSQGGNILYRIDPQNGGITNLGLVPILTGNNYTYGAVYFDKAGNFYISTNQTGTVYIVKNVSGLTGSNAMISNLFAYGPSASSNDGARCPTAPVLIEECDNGIDDDADGLIDCEDPSCSGYSGCPVIVQNVSTGNQGGLESNNRLSELISKRNYDRTKTAYKFDVNKAKKVRQQDKFSKNSGESILKQYIPLNKINEDEVVNSTPTDLSAITNASEVYSVDYRKNNHTIASILALKTDNKVYEHTKYICDRLLGGQIISVSTIHINDEPFIKTIIKNADNSTEYVLSFSAKKINNDANFGIESHWNIDKYTQNVGYFNFQIWTNSVDDLYSLGLEIINLLNQQKSILEYKTSTPPTVFVRKGAYVNGQLQLQIINTNATGSVIFDAGIRKTETSVEEKLNNSLILDKKFLSNITIETGNLFDIGFRIGDGIATPDDLFLSDGSWGVDAPKNNSSVTQYTVTQNSEKFADNTYKIERNVLLKAITSDYVSAYKALTPRFAPVDLSAYKSLHLKAKGNGILEIILIKNSISDWEKQYKKSIVMSDELKDFAIPLSEFTSSIGLPLVLNDLKTITFKMTSSDGQSSVKEMDLQMIQFSKDLTLSATAFKDIENDISLIPNPMGQNSILKFTSVLAGKAKLEILNSSGTLVKEMELEVVSGVNQISISRDNLASGVYFCKISGTSINIEAQKLIVK
ncbi:DUF6923 family protein [Flavobacterium sp. TSSA_36]|uniref:DUF6923 family protein n=1 Tax=Flavobacterium sp. TSSA_36 TaxID=3447669 RepID=UPI003F3BA64E